MKLYEIKASRKSAVKLDEGIIPTHIEMMLEKVIKDGKITDDIQVFTIANLMRMLQFGGPYQWPREIANPDTDAPSEAIDEVFKFTNAEAVSAATFILNELARMVQFSDDPPLYRNPGLSTREWFDKFVKPVS